MRSKRLAFCIMAGLLAACGPGTPPDGTAETPVTDAAHAQLPAPAELPREAEATHAGRVGADAVWNGPVEACRAEAAGPGDTCLVEAMRADDASPAAIAIAERLRGRGEAGHISAWQERDGIGIATVAYPFRANTNQGTWLVDSEGTPVDVDALADSALSVPSIEAFRAAHPDAHPFAPSEFVDSETRADGGVRFVYATPMRSCHACDTLGRIRVAYDFDSERQFAGQQVLGIE